MKDFLSEYGFAILAAIVVILLIAMCTPVGSLIKNQIMGVVDSFATKTESKLYSMDADNALGVIITQLDENGNFKIVASSDSETDVLKASYRVKDQNGNWGPWTDLGNLGSGKDHSGEFQAKIENGNKIQVRVTDEGKADNLYYESNIVEYTGSSSAGGEFTPTAGEGGSTSTLVSKGQIITIEGSQYRVLSVNGTQAKVLAMSDAISIVFNNSSFFTTSFGGTEGQKYEDSNIDSYLKNAWFVGLSQDMKDAIVPQDITQNMIKWQGAPAALSSWYKTDFTESDTSGNNYTLSKTGGVSVGSRHVFALDVQDVIDYLGSEFDPQDLNEMFWNQRSAIDKYIWLRSANAGNADYAFLVNGSRGIVGGSNCTNTLAVRPAFVIDLSMIEFE